VAASDLIEMVPGATHGALMTESTCLPLPGLAAHPLLAPRSPAVDAARRLTGVVFASFLAVHAGELLRVGVFGDLRETEPETTLLLVLPAGFAAGLTRRELEVLGLVVEGCTNHGIARALRIAPRTAAAHVEHILDKLGCESRCAAAVQAVRAGSYIPGALSGGGSGAVSLPPSAPAG
jgi:DNA-binding CsgD family transcriptional regulator